MARLRRPADQARRAILEAAGKRLREGGPEAVRLQDVARDLGVSHPAILHHFGSRDGLMQALAAHVVASLEAELLAGLRDAPSEATVLDLVTRVFDALGDAGHARLLAWRALSGDARAAGPAAGRTLLGELSDLVHRRRTEHARNAGKPSPPREDSEFVVRLAAAAMLGEGVGGGIFDRSFGLGAGAAEARHRFRVWLARLLVAHEGISPPRAAAPGSRRGGRVRPRGGARPARP